jgi:hypothetical protein
MKAALLELLFEIPYVCEVQLLKSAKPLFVELRIQNFLGKYLHCLLGKEVCFGFPHCYNDEEELCHNFFVQTCE